jgi:predicted adenylyl cyclase CyaB
MPANLEIKARLTDVKSAIHVAHSIHADHAGILRQKDTYYRVPQGRLKLRQISGKHSELIFYKRSEKSDRRKSDFHILSVNDPSGVDRFLRKAFPVIGVIVKKRILFLKNETRIHIDEVKGLGNFLEFEVPIKSNLKLARKQLNELIKIFGISKQDFIKKSYIDCLREKKGKK